MSSGKSAIRKTSIKKSMEQFKGGFIREKLHSILPVSKLYNYDYVENNCQKKETI